MRIYIPLKGLIIFVFVFLISSSSAWASFEKFDLGQAGDINFSGQIYDKDKSIDKDDLPEESSPAILAASDKAEKKKKKARKKKRTKKKKNKSKKSKEKMKDKDRDDELDKGKDENEEHTGEKGD
ncbi:MAG: hypothetical protein VW455_10540 [Nitrospinota bacterium]